MTFNEDIVEMEAGNWVRRACWHIDQKKCI